MIQETQLVPQEEEQESTHEQESTNATANTSSSQPIIRAVANSDETTLGLSAQPVIPVLITFPKVVSTDNSARVANDLALLAKGKWGFLVSKTSHTILFNGEAVGTYLAV